MIQKCPSRKMGNDWHFGMKAHVGVDMATGLVHTVVGTAGNVSDVTQAHALLHGGEKVVLGDAGYQGVAKRPENADNAISWHTAMRPGLRKARKKNTLDARKKSWSTRRPACAPRLRRSRKMYECVTARP